LICHKTYRQEFNPMAPSTLCHAQSRVQSRDLPNSRSNAGRIICGQTNKTGVYLRVAAPLRPSRRATLSAVVVLSTVLHEKEEPCRTCSRSILR
jgi:hypothetical protein